MKIVKLIAVAAALVGLASCGSTPDSVPPSESVAPASSYEAPPVK